MKKIYILHEYYTPSHFQALYNCAGDYGFKIQEYIVISKKYLFQTFIHELHHSKKPLIIIYNFVKKIIRTYTIKYLKNENLIVGIAPYNYLMNSYKKLFKKNSCIYFTSWDTWDGSNFPKGTLKNKRNYEEILINYFKGVACVTKSVQNAVSFLKLPSQVVFHSISTQKYKPITQKKLHCPLKLIYIGQFIYRKGIDYIIRFLKENPELQFSIDLLGGGILKNEINTICKEDNRIHNLGFHSKEYIQSILREYDFMVLPTRAEPFGIVIIESMAAGTPVLASDVTGPKEIITDNKNSFLFKNENYSDFSEKVKKLFSITQEQYQELSFNALNSALKYDEKELVKNWIQLF